MTYLFVTSGQCEGKLRTQINPQFYQEIPSESRNILRNKLSYQAAGDNEALTAVVHIVYIYVAGTVVQLVLNYIQVSPCCFFRHHAFHLAATPLANSHQFRG